MNPLDADAVRAVANASRLPVQPLVGTLTGLREAIERAYAGRTTRVVRGYPSEMPPEITRKVDALGGGDLVLDTATTHRLVAEATIEQRHEALLLALIERVCSRAPITTRRSSAFCRAAAIERQRGGPMTAGRANERGRPSVR